MSLADFIRNNRDAIDAVAHARLKCPATVSCWLDYDTGKRCPQSGTKHTHGKRLNDDDRRERLLNDEGLYSWARSEGCRI